MAESKRLTPYDAIGGEAAVRELVERFYTHMDTLPETRGIRDMHARDLTGAKTKLFKFLTGWLGGPDLYIREYGHPRLRMRHFPFAIGPSERDQWVLCMRRALDGMEMDEGLREALLQALADLATHMINQPGGLAEQSR